MLREPTAEELRQAEEDDRKKGPWHPDDDALIIRLWLSGRWSLDKIGERVDRSVRSVDTRLWKLCSGYAPYTPTGDTDRTHLLFTYEDYAVMSACVKPKGVSNGKANSKWIALVLRRSTRCVQQRMDWICWDKSGRGERKRMATQENEADRIKLVQTWLGNQYGFGKGLAKLGHHKKRSR